jgi:hypothetical protein
MSASLSSQQIRGLAPGREFLLYLLQIITKLPAGKGEVEDRLEMASVAPIKCRVQLKF